MRAPVPKVQGSASRKVWKYRVVDQAKIRRSFMIADAAAIAAVVRSQHEAAAVTVGGIEVYYEIETAISRGRS